MKDEEFWQENPKLKDHVKDIYADGILISKSTSREGYWKVRIRLLLGQDWVKFLSVLIGIVNLWVAHDSRNLLTGRETAVYSRQSLFHLQSRGQCVQLQGYLQSVN
jgi:hypothetical protein